MSSKHGFIRHYITHTNNQGCFECKIPGCKRVFKFDGLLRLHTRLHFDTSKKSNNSKKKNLSWSNNDNLTNNLSPKIKEKIKKSETPKYRSIKFL